MITAENELATLVKAHTKQLFSYTLAKVEDKEAAKDIVQNTFLAAIESYASFHKKSSPKAWMYAILKNKIADYYRNKYKKTIHEMIEDSGEVFINQHGRWKPSQMPKSWDSDEQLLNDSDFIKVLSKSIEALPMKWASVIKLKYIDGQDSKSICKHLCITPANFWQIIRRSKLQLRNDLELQWFNKK